MQELHCNLMSKNGAVPYVAKYPGFPGTSFITQDGEEGKEQYITNMQVVHRLDIVF